MNGENIYCYEYPRPALTVDCILLSKIKDFSSILLIKRKFEPYKDCWALPGGYVDNEESAEDAVKREIREETGLELELFEQYKTFSAVDRDPRGRTISIVFYSFIDIRSLSLKAGDDASETRWFSVDNLPLMAFDHKHIVECAIPFLRMKLLT